MPLTVILDPIPVPVIPDILNRESKRMPTPSLAALIS